MEDRIEEIKKKIAELKSVGHSIDTIIKILSSSGYSSEEIEKALRDYFKEGKAEEKKISELPKLIPLETSKTTKEVKTFGFLLNRKTLFIILPIIIAGITFFFLFPYISTFTHKTKPTEVFIPTQGPVPSPIPTPTSPTYPSTTPSSTPSQPSTSPTTPTPSQPGTMPTSSTYPQTGGITSTCGNYVCEPGEDSINCPIDCTTTSQSNQTYTGYSETYTTSTTSTCGNYVCEPGEDSINCPIDCTT